MRTTRIVVTCDQCAWAGQADVDAPFPVTVTITGVGDDTARAIDCCPEHLPAWRSLVEQLAGTAPVSKPTTPPRVKDRSGRKSGPGQDKTRYTCTICRADVATRGGLVTHIRQVHLAGVELPPAPSTCPECGREFGSAHACGPHRVRAHGYDLLADTYADAERQGTRQRRRRRTVRDRVA